MRFPELSYANADDPPLKRGLIRFLERLAGRDYFAPLYDQWRSETVSRSQRTIRPMLGLIDVELEIVARQWPPQVQPDRPIVLVANHPFGILDGIAAMTMAEDLGRPFRVLINMELMKVPEMAPYSLPIDFRESRSAQATNLRTRNEAIRLLGEGTTIIVFPAGALRLHQRHSGARWNCRGSRSPRAWCRLRAPPCFPSTLRVNAVRYFTSPRA